MATQDCWAEAPLSRFQSTLFAPTLDEMIDGDSQLHIFDEVLESCDWTQWEAEYNGKRGQPPIHPRWVAAVILYGLFQGIRSSRKLEYLGTFNIDFMWLVEGRSIDHSTISEDPTQPVPEELWPQLPRNGRKQLAKSCFVRAEERDVYYCPQGHEMPFGKTKPDERNGERITLRVYRCHGCAGCLLAQACLDAKAQHGRTITRDPYEGSRERMAAKMKTEAARQIYHQRPHMAETPLAILKSVMNFRRFLLRGLEKVKTECMTWAVTAFNLKKLVRELRRMLAEFAELIAATEG